MTDQTMLNAMAGALLQAESQHWADTGYGNATVRGIANSLLHGSLEAAMSEWCHDGDKVQSWPKLKEAVIAVMGCRMHGQQDCQGWLCSGKRYPITHSLKIEGHQMKVRVPTRHGGVWTIHQETCHLSTYSEIMLTTFPESVEDSSYLLIPEWNGWRFFASNSEGANIAVPIEVLEKLIEMARASEKTSAG